MVKEKKWREVFPNIELFCKDVIIVGIKEIQNRLHEKELSLVLTNSLEMRKLNKQYRGKDKPTNVLSFSSNDPFLGDIVLDLETIQKEANVEKKKFENHVAHLLIHGLLHLHGFTHGDEQAAEKMEKKEIDILEKLRIKNLYV